MSRLPHVWGATSDEVLRDYPADRLLDGRTTAMTRAVRVAAPRELSWRWLCQIAVAPYSYDLLDNRGRRSPRELTPGADELHVGKLMMIFRVTSYEPGHHWTGVTTPGAARLFGPVAVTYAAEPDGSDPTASRMVCRLVSEVDGRVARVRAPLLAWGDLVMMRKELLTLKQLAERDAERSRSPLA
ncbi:hypothetical protein NSZ01_13410 [Nocardioides szechwanensis]|uniref:Polyketide cyclase / dehydrase and lipid transport n=1 Tax=Nocardioides szechwanensis TaxID=1005944 RepID=A0A1H0BZJ2_9ACTN|nr:hypothetical protein [Nocardioides szechwanensis]GEP33573.1 hypothetical protein NSZ01_13410 [Nocardioides szechwanensis]SDN51054.1 hypothetical protein SAMN05192576_2279 [Nocardioides szechwanensis]